MKQLYIVKSYLSYLLKAKNLHGVHSPFVYDFNLNVVNDNRHFYAYDVLSNFRNTLLKNTNTLQVEDFGAGSHTTKSNTRRINDITKNAGKVPKHGKLLFRIVNYYGCKNLLELGTSMGIGSSYLALANSNAHLTTIEGSQAIAHQAQQHFQALGLKNISTVVGQFDAVLPTFLQQLKTPLDLVFVDGNHQYEPTLKYFEMLLPHMSANGIMIFDDIHWSKDMYNAWCAIKQDNRVLMSIDVFQFGIVFFNPDFKEKQDFTIRF